MRIGSLVYATEQGLGRLAKSFYDHGVVTDVMVVRHGTHPTHDEWYPGAPQISDLRAADCLPRIDAFMRRMDAVLFFETPFKWEAFGIARDLGVKTALMTMYECSHERPPDVPDLYVCPSLLDLQYFPQKSVYLPVPVEVPWRRRERAEVFVHNSGHGGLRGRNGTAELIQALDLVESPAEFIFRSQSKSIRDDLRAVFKPTRSFTLGGDTVLAQNAKGQRLRYDGGTALYETLWDEGDVFVFPEKFNGLSLPLQEARAAGMLVMATNRFPMRTWLPVAPLIPPNSTFRDRIGPPYMEYDSAIVTPAAIAATIDQWYGRDISAYSESGREWAMKMSWDVLGPQYKALLEGLVR